MSTDTAVQQRHLSATDRLKAATEDLAAAQHDVERALSELKTSARADKAMIGDALRSALERVTNARTRITEAVNQGGVS